jgi:hypothetical protein
MHASLTRMSHYPVMFDVAPPVRWDRSQVLLRLLIFAALGLVGLSLGWFFLVVYMIVPIVAAVLISQRGTVGYLHGPGEKLLRLFHWWNAGVAYLAFLTDRFPTAEGDLHPVLFEASPRSVSGVGAALGRLLSSLPEALVLFILTWIGGIVWLVAAVGVLVNQRVPDFAWRYLRFVVGLSARLLVYHASLTDRYPPLAAPSHQELYL